MKILIIGATGNLGRCILKESTDRGHSVTAVSRHHHESEPLEAAAWVIADASDATALVELFRGQDAIACALSPWAAGGRDSYLAAIRAVLVAAKETDALYIIFSGGASSLRGPDGRDIIETQLEQVNSNPQMRMMLEEAAVPVYAAYQEIKASDVRWTFQSPAGKLEDGSRTGQYRTAGEVPVGGTPMAGAISFADFAVAALDELESPKNVRRQYSVAY